MGKPHPIELRERVVAFVEEGNTHRSAAAHFRVLIKFVNDMVKLKRETGALVPKPRFLILPWIEIPNLGSHILALVRRHLPEDWAERYNTAPVMIETFVETPRYTGAVYRASGWTRVGTTRGRGRYDRDKLYDKPRKDIWLRPLRRDWKRTLNR